MFIDGNVNTLRARQNGCHFVGDILKYISLNENVWISIKISPKFASEGPINNIPALVQIMAWRRPGDKLFTGDPLHSRAACTQPCNVNTHSRAHCSPGARLCEQWGHGCVNNGARLCASARLCRGSPVLLSEPMMIHLQCVTRPKWIRPKCRECVKLFGGSLWVKWRWIPIRYNTLCASMEVADAMAFCVY